MTHVEFGQTGAKRTSVEESDPFKEYINLFEMYPQASTAELLRRFTQLCLDEEDLNRATIAYTFANLEMRRKKYGYGEKPVTRDRATTTKRIAQRTSSIRETMKKHIRRKAEELLMEIIMPNGKRLADCSLKYCGEFGGWMSRIGAAGKANQLVRHVLNEEQLRDLRKAA